MSAKLLLNFKNETYDKIIISYIGGRYYSQSLTRSALITMIIENQFQDRQTILRGKNSISYSITELFNAGIEIIKRPFQEILNIKADKSFYNKLTNLNTNISYKAKKELSDCIIENTISLKNILTHNDIETVKDIIYPISSYEYDDGYLKCVFDFNDKKYWVIEEVTSIIDRYTSIQSKLKYYSILSNFIIKQYEKLGLKDLYIFSNEQLIDYDNYDSIEFFNTFFKNIEETYNYVNKINPLSNVDISSEFSDEDLNFLRHYVPNLILNSNVNKFYCYNPNKDLYYFIKNDLEKILLTSLNIDIKLNMEYYFSNDTFYYRDVFINLLNHTYKNILIDTSKNIYIRKKVL